MKTTIEKFKKGTSYVPLHKAVSQEELYKSSTILTPTNKKLVKFIPASGAATRMFDQLYKYQETKQSNEFVETFKTNIKKFAFYDSLQLEHLSPDEQINKVLETYGHSPKALINIHHYDTPVTPIDEHIYESKGYIKDKLNLHFTISEDHEVMFTKYIANHISDSLEITYSFQDKKTDTYAVTEDNKPFLDDNGDYLTRPGGHGSLIHNLNNIDADIIYIKNIDNVCHRNVLEDTINSKKELTSIGLEVQSKIFELIHKLHQNDISLDIVTHFLKDTLNITYKEELTKEKALQFLDRPLRVCGMVKNEGEPGGGPFIIDNGDYLDPQILEMKEIDVVKEKHVLDNAGYFNPVDLVCFVKDYTNNKFNLLDYINEDRYFISEKSFKGKTLKALEHPGLWNGAMHNWNTIFVEVPLSTFNPIKTVNDLLRRGHQG